MQYTSLLETEGLKLEITEDAIDKMSSIAVVSIDLTLSVGSFEMHLNRYSSFDTLKLISSFATLIADSICFVVE